MDGPPQASEDGAPFTGPIPGPEPAAATEKVVQGAFTANRDELYSAWNAIANLAEMAGKVEIEWNMRRRRNRHRAAEGR
jgi:hypothetical protein